MKRGEILKEAERLMYGDRQEDYGTPYENHRRIAVLWSAYLGTEVSPMQVAICMALVKIARLQQNFEYSKDDTFVDLAAYASIAAELAEIKRNQDKQQFLSPSAKEEPLHSHLSCVGVLLAFQAFTYSRK